MDQVVKLVPEGIELIGDMEDDVINALYNKVLGLGNIFQGLGRFREIRGHISDRTLNIRERRGDAGFIILLTGVKSCRRGGRIRRRRGKVKRKRPANITDIITFKNDNRIERSNIRKINQKRS